jgi:hypothetical protein
LKTLPSAGLWVFHLAESPKRWTVGVGPAGSGVLTGCGGMVGAGGCVGAVVAVGSGVDVGGMAIVVWVMLTITVSATWVKIMLGSRVGSAGAAEPQAERTSAAKVNIVTHAVILVFVFILDQLPFLLVKLL